MLRKFVVGFFLVLFAATQASAQSYETRRRPDRTLYLMDAIGDSIEGAEVRYRFHGLDDWMRAREGERNGYEISSIEVKTDVIVRHRSFGERRVTLDLEAAPRADFLIEVQSDGVAVKALQPGRAWDLFGWSSEPEYPAPPPPGQGCQMPDLRDAWVSDPGETPCVSYYNCWDYLIYDNFRPAVDGFITHAVWWGGYSGNCQGLNTRRFNITYYRDNNGRPGQAIASFRPGLRQRMQTGNTIGFGLAEVFFVSNFHQAVPVNAGECYWISIEQDNDSQSCEFYWETSDQGDGYGWRYSDVVWISHRIDTDLAFCVSISTVPEACPEPPPSNNNCDGALPISGEGVFAFDNRTASATGPQDEALCKEFGQTGFDQDVWYAWTAPCTGEVEFKTCESNGDTKIGVYDSADCPDFATGPLVCNDNGCGDGSRVTFAAQAGATYLLRVGYFPGYSGNGGTIEILCLPPPPANDVCSGAEPLLLDSPIVGATTSAQADDVPFCDTELETAGGVWYEVIGNGNRLRASLCRETTDYDTKIAIFCGLCDPLQCIKGNDDQCDRKSRVFWRSNPGERYLVYVTGAGFEEGNFELRLDDLGSHDGAAYDCSVPVQLGGLEIDSNVDGLFVRVSPADRYWEGAGLTPFAREYEYGTDVRIVAPEQWNGQQLLGWRIGGRALPSHNGIIEGTIEVPRTAVRPIYGDPSAPDVWR